MKATHTPGPWRTSLDIDGRHHAIPILAPWNCDGNEAYHPKIAQANFDLGGPSREIAEANAILIKAAPDLLAALEIAQKWLANSVVVEGANISGPKPLPVIAAALALAKGGGK